MKNGVRQERDKSHNKVTIIPRNGTERHIPWHYSPERNRADIRVLQRINYSISYLVAMHGVLERLDL